MSPIEEERIIPHRTAHFESNDLFHDDGSGAIGIANQFRSAMSGELRLVAGVGHVGLPGPEQTCRRWRKLQNVIRAAEVLVIDFGGNVTVVAGKWRTAAGCDIQRIV